LASFQVAVMVGLLVSSSALAGAPGAGRVGVMVSGLRSDSGVVRCGLYAGPGGFPKPGQEARGTVPGLNNKARP